MSNTTFFKNRTNPTYEGLQFNGKNSKEVAAFVQGILGADNAAGVKAGGSYVKITWENGTETVVRKSNWVLTAGSNDVIVFTENDTQRFMREVKGPIVKKK